MLSAQLYQIISLIPLLFGCIYEKQGLEAIKRQEPSLKHRFVITPKSVAISYG